MNSQFSWYLLIFFKWGAMDEDTTILTNISRGSQEALRVLYQKYRPRLYSYLWRRLSGDAFLIEETLQDIFLAVWNSASSFRGEARIATWLFRIAQHSASQVQNRKSQRHSREFVSLAEIGEEKHTIASFTEEESVVNRMTLDDALNQLADKHREVLVLMFIQGFTQEEIAHILDIPLGTVKSRLLAARNALHTHLVRKEP
jgi:RNA polymerase sigma-70 factor, ECF subfamily